MNPWTIALHLSGAKCDKCISDHINRKKYALKPEVKEKRNARELALHKTDRWEERRIAARAEYQRKKQDPEWHAAFLASIRNNKIKLKAWRADNAG